MAAATAASHVCRKHRINQVFARPEAERIDHAISFAVHPVMSEVTLLLKHRLMEETSALGAAGRDVAPLVIDVDDVERAISAVVGKVQVRRHGASLTAPPRVPRMRGGPFGWRRPRRGRNPTAGCAKRPSAPMRRILRCR